MNRKERQERYTARLHELQDQCYISYMPEKIEPWWEVIKKRITHDITHEEVIEFLHGTSVFGDWSIDEVMDELYTFVFIDDKLKVEDALVIEGIRNYCYNKLNEHGNLMPKPEADSWRKVFYYNNPIKNKELGREVNPELLEAFMGLSYTYLARVVEIHK